MGRFREKLWTWMAGRYGVDSLYYALLVLSLIFWIIQLIFPHWIWAVLCLTVLAFAIFRFLSRNRVRRAKENAVWMKVWGPIKAWFRLQMNRLKDIRTRRYRRCPHCKAVLRLPVRRGGHTVTCPRCQTDFRVRILF